MEPYQNSNSGIAAYQIGPDYILVQFKTGGAYRYTYRSAGSYNVEQMKGLARAGRGLNTFVNKNVKYKYELLNFA